MKETHRNRFETRFTAGPMITSFQNPLVKRIKRLRQKKYRQDEGAFFVEGLRPVLAAVDSGAPVEVVVYSAQLLTSDVAWRMLAEQRSAGQRCVELAAPVFKSISEREHPVGLGAIASTTWVELEAFAPAPRDIFVALVGVSDPGNLGTVLRTIDAVRGAGVILVGATVDPFHPTAVRASMGALFSVPISRVDSLNPLWRWAASQELHTIATSSRASESFWGADFRYPALLLIGSEGEGLPPDVLAAAGLAVSIPMEGSASSLNMAVAAGLLLYALHRQRPPAH